MKGLSLFSARLARYRGWVFGVIVSIVIVDLIGLLPPYVLGEAVDFLRLSSGDPRLEALQKAAAVRFSVKDDSPESLRLEARKWVEAQNHRFDAARGAEKRAARGISTGILPLFALCIVGIEICRASMRFTWRRIAWDFSRRVELDLRNEFFAKSVKLTSSFFDGTTIGDLMSRATSDIDQVRMFFGMGLLTLFDTLTIVVTTFPILVWLNPRLTLYTTLPLPFLAIICWRIFMETHRRSRAVQEQYGDLTARVIENLNGIRVVKAYATEAVEVERFEDLSDVQVSLSLRLAKIQAVFFPVFTIVLETGTLLVLWIGGSGVVRGELTVGDFVRYTWYLGWLTGPMVGLGWTLSLYQRGIASIERLNQILLRPDPEDAASGEATPGAVEFRDLTFSFGEGRPNALEHVSFSVPAGTKVAVVGRTGSGKTTLVQLLPRLYEPPRGTVFIGGKDVRDLPAASLRRLIAFVPQDGFLFSDTLAENVGFAFETPDAAAVEAASRAACLDEAIQRFPNKYDQIVGERGVTLSGGQKQRACLARAFAADAPILILDDAFSSVDAETEEKVVANLREAGKGKTVFVISHRLSSVMDADQIVVLDKGRIAAKGTHEELLRHGGIYAELWRKQQLQEALR